MKMKDYQATIVAAVSAKEAFRAIGQVSKWWTSDLEGRSENLNDVFTVTFGDTFATAKIVEVVPESKVVWHVTDCNLHWINNKKEWKDTEMIFELSSQGKKTQIRFTHVGIIPGIECYNDCSMGWNHYIKRSLLGLMTEGKGLLEKK